MVTVTLNDAGKITDVNFVEWIMHELDDRVYTQQHVAKTYAILIQKGCSVEQWKDINIAIINRWSVAGLLRIKTMAWRIHNERNQ